MRKYQQAFTLIELMITVSIAAIVLAIAIPSFNIQILNHRSIALGEELATSMNYARSEAVKRGTRVSVCASNNGTACIGTWTDGWIVFVDAAVTDNAAAGVIASPPAEGVLRYWSDIDSRASIVATGGKTLIRFTGLGTLGRVDNNPVAITSHMTGCKNNAARTTEVGLSGAVNMARTNCP